VTLASTPAATPASGAPARTSPVAGLRVTTRLGYGLGAVALGVKDTGFNTFLLLFYNQVLGLSAGLAGLALMLTLIGDAVLDPLIGVVSDGWRSRLGRRHPFMYAAVLPAAAAHLLLWIPPHGLAGAALFWWLLALSMAGRFCFSLFEVPFVSLVPAITTDYDERTRLIGWMTVFGWWGGLAMAVLAYAVFLRPTAGDTSGLLHAQGFAAYGLAASAAMLVTMLIASLATQGAARGAPAAARARITLAGAARTFAALLAHRSVRALLASVVLLFIGQGFAGALYAYIQVFFWDLTGPQMGLLSLAPVVSATLALLVTPRLAAGREKRAVATWLMMAAIVVQPLPMLLRLAGLFPANGASLLMPLLALHSTFETTVWVMFSIITSSMVADLVEDTQRQGGGRREGALFALRILAQKAVSGLGVLLSGLLLAFIRFPAHARQGHVPQPTLDHLALTYTPIFMALGVAGVIAMQGYRLTRAGHERNLAALVT